MTEALLSPAVPAVNVEALRSAADVQHAPVVPADGARQQRYGRLDQIIGRRRKVARGASLFRIGDPFQNLYAIRLGHFKTYQVNRDGVEQITGFQMAGELLGMDAISADRTTAPP
jgi:CRP/FNR family transcriptional regulator